eukprot:COSAG02_NODE_17877_length_970_cov_1.171429_3_plen_28_part_01
MLGAITTLGFVTVGQTGKMAEDISTRAE